MTEPTEFINYLNGEMPEGYRCGFRLDDDGPFLVVYNGDLCCETRLLDGDMDDPSEAVVRIVEPMIAGIDHFDD